MLKKKKNKANPNINFLLPRDQPFFFFLERKNVVVKNRDMQKPFFGALLSLLSAT